MHFYNNYLSWNRELVNGVRNQRRDERREDIRQEQLERKKREERRRILQTELPEIAEPSLSYYPSMYSLYGSKIIGQKKGSRPSTGSLTSRSSNSKWSRVFPRIVPSATRSSGKLETHSGKSFRNRAHSERLARDGSVESWIDANMPGISAYSMLIRNMETDHNEI